MQRLDFFDKFFIERAGVEQEIQHKADNRQNQYEQKPRHFVFRIVVGRDDFDYACDLRG